MRFSGKGISCERVPYPHLNNVCLNLEGESGVIDTASILPLLNLESDSSKAHEIIDFMAGH